jgi:hypothetical protein
MPVTPLLILIAVAHQGHILRPTQFLQQPQREFLTMVLGVAIALVDAAAFLELLPINVIAARSQTPSTNTRRKDAQAVSLTINR